MSVASDEREQRATIRYCTWRDDFPEPGSLTEARERLDDVSARIEFIQANLTERQSGDRSLEAKSLRIRTLHALNISRAQVRLLKRWIQETDQRKKLWIDSSDHGDLSQPLAMIRAMHKVLHDIIQEEGKDFLDQDEHAVYVASCVYLGLAFDSGKGQP